MPGFSFTPRNSHIFSHISQIGLSSFQIFIHRPLISRHFSNIYREFTTLAILNHFDQLTTTTTLSTRKQTNNTIAVAISIAFSIAISIPISLDCHFDRLLLLPIVPSSVPAFRRSSVPVIRGYYLPSRSIDSCYYCDFDFAISIDSRNPNSIFVVFLFIPESDCRSFIMEGPQAIGSAVAADIANTFVQVLCCVCGIPITPNAANTCASCLASSSDITRGISTEVTLHQCRSCQRWHKEAGKWIACELESRELMALCLGNVSGLKATKGSGQKVRLVDAAWIWTEPHSMRLKVRLTIQKEVQQGTILQQSFTVVFVVRNQQCIECQAEFRQGSWKALVQVRQRVAHKRTFLYLEQLILKHGAHRGCLSIETYRDGMDFYFPDKGKAARFISFLENVVPTKVSIIGYILSRNF
jgi:hypothetical protein